MINTLSRVFLNTEKNYRKEALMLVKREGKYCPISTDEFSQRVRNISAGLRAFGLKSGDKLIILSENRPEWVMVDLAAICLGAVTVPIYTSLTPPQIKYIINDSEARFVVCSNPEMWSRLEAIRTELPLVDKYIMIEDLAPAGVLSLREVEKEGEKLNRQNPGEFDKIAESIRPDDLATIIYTSGTTGVPKGAMLSHYNLVSNVQALRSVIEFTDKDTALSFLPLSHVLERMCTFAWIYVGATIAYAESVDTVAQNLVEARPTIMVSVPRLFDKFYARVIDNVLSSSNLKKKIFFWALKTGRKYAQKKINREKISGWLKFRYGLAYKLVFSKIVEKTGGRVRFFVSGGAPLSRDIAEFFYAMGILVIEGYGLTETSPVIAVNRLEDFRFGSVGKILPEVEVKIAADGEIWARGPNVMKGYFKKEAETREAFEDGWFKTGDIGYLDKDGYLVITDRKKDILVTAGGKNVAPQPIENTLKSSPYIANAVVVGNHRKFVSALIVPDFDKLEIWARENNVAFGDRKELAARPEVYEFYMKEIDRLTPHLASYEKIKKIALLDKDFEIEAGELTPTLKVRRKIVEEKYKDLIDRMYTE
ncbi:MAG: O-succinylbenzoic acid--CoA ligase [Candidatus Saccharicenans subterraneus]|uniref:O-succinylbenzoic acid--CoA ligase n=1 Tax=Candidatus Saccharicenans subterraneus TaxID=2508984 RepID=A0A3E2BNQ3_9BACT|nr:MAG: O-succinylbenzoic acid--CoA ligase [Candidatus Saccharicenans subterraneum]